MVDKKVSYFDGVPKIREITRHIGIASDPEEQEIVRRHSISFLSSVIRFYHGKPNRSMLRAKLERVVRLAKADLAKQ